MPLYAEEIACPVCELQIVFLNEQGEVMVEMIAVDDPSDWTNEDVNEYLTMLEVEATGDMYLTKRYLPTRPQRADLVQLKDGNLGVRFSNRVTLEDVRKRSRQKAVRGLRNNKFKIAESKEQRTKN
jgi:hypothetical protein